MKVILKQEVDNLGLAGDVVDVADGYGRNFLLPRGMAIVATKGSMKEAEAMLRSRKAKEAATVGDATAYAEALESRNLRIEVRVDDRGHLYGSVTKNDVARVLKERGHDIPAKRIELAGSIKEIGTYEIPVQVHPQVTATVKIEVLDIEGEVIFGQIKAYEPPPMPGEEPVEAPAAEGDAAQGDAAEGDAAEAASDTEADAIPTPDEVAAAIPEAGSGEVIDDIASPKGGGSGSSIAMAAITAALEYEAAAAERLEGNDDTEEAASDDDADDEAAEA